MTMAIFVLQQPPIRAPDTWSRKIRAPESPQISEALTLDRSDWQREQVVVMGKRRKERVVIISPKARAAVDQYLALRTDPSPALFIGFQRGMVGGVENRLTPGGAGYVCDQVARRLGLERWHPHQLRHTFGTAVEEELGDPRLTAELLGHSGLGSVSGYTKISRRRREEAAAALADRGF
jgi:integrase